MKSKKNLIILAIVIAISLIGVTYAFFDYYMIGSNQKITAGKVNLVFNEGEDTIDRGNIFPETVEKARARDDNFITFTVSGVNTTEDQDIYYEIMLNEGDTETGMTRFNPEDLVFDLIEVNGTTETYLVNAMSFSDINARRIWVDTITKGTSTTKSRTYKLRMWLNEDVKISDTNTNANYPSTGYENYYASVKVSVYGDFKEKYIVNYMAKTGTNNYAFWPDNIEAQKANISEVNFVSLTSDEINSRVAASTINADVTDTTKTGGSVKAWLETDTTDTTKYIMYVASEGTTYFPSDCYKMFGDWSSVTSFTFENVNTSQVTNMFGMFISCLKLVSLDIGGWNTENVDNMSYMICNCQSLTSLDLSNWNVENVTDMSFMFVSSSNLISIDLTNWNVRNATNFSTMFAGCANLTTIYANSDWNTGDETISNGMFSGCTNLVGAVSYDSTKADITMANPTTGYFTRKEA